MSLIAASPITAFEQERLERIAENRRRMGEFGFLAFCCSTVTGSPSGGAPYMH